jgi:hypothetical protein
MLRWQPSLFRHKELIQRCSCSALQQALKESSTVSLARAQPKSKPTRSDRSSIAPQPHRGKKKGGGDCHSNPKAWASKEFCRRDLGRRIHWHGAWGGKRLQPAAKPVLQHGRKMRSVEQHFFEDANRKRGTNAHMKVARRAHEETISSQAYSRRFPKNMRSKNLIEQAAATCGSPTTTNAACSKR